MTNTTIKHITAKGAPAPGGSYSHGVIANGFLYTCGMGPVDPATGTVVEGGVGPQTRQTLINLKAILDEVGADFSQVVKTTAHLQNCPEDFAEYDKVYRELIPSPFPVRTTVGSDLSDILVEIDMVVAL